MAAGAPLGGLILACAVGAVRMFPEWLVVGSSLLLLSVLGFAAGAKFERKRASHRRPAPPLVEPFLLAFAGLTAVVLEYPSVLRHPFLTPLRGLSVTVATALLVAITLLGALALGGKNGGRVGALLMAASIALFVFAAWRLSLSPPIDETGGAPSNQTVLFGIDSMSQADEHSVLKSSVARLAGTWYERPVPPGLLTNSVWPAIVLDRPVRETGVFLVFQTPDWEGASFNLVETARERGCRTLAMFSTRFSFYLGRDAGFEVDRSGPRGWLQLATAYVKDGSVFLPVALARVGPIPGAISPANHSGTFSYDLRRDVHSILTSGTASGCSLIGAHLDYMHQTAFPPFSEMTASERRAVRSARVDLVRDLTFSWQPPIVTGDPLDIERWKLANLQRVIVAELERTRFLSSEKANRLVLFSDHGNRRRINDDNFGDPRYHRVIFVTFGIPPRDPEDPISLLDISSMLGYADAARKSADPVVEYTNVTAEEWGELSRSARLLSNGRVLLDGTIVRGAGARLKGFRPYAPGGYFPSPLRRDPPL